MNSIGIGLTLLVLAPLTALADDPTPITSGRGGNVQNDVALYARQPELRLTDEEVRQRLGLPRIDPALVQEGRKARTMEERVRMLRVVKQWASGTKEDVIQLFGPPDQILKKSEMLMGLVYFSTYRDPLDFDPFSNRAHDTLVVMVQDGVVTGWQMMNLPKVLARPW